MSGLLIVYLYCSAGLNDMPRLGHRSFAVRESAQRSLESRGLWAWPAVQCGQHSSDAEIRHRCRRLEHSLDAAYTAAFDRAFALYDVPCIDALWYDAQARTHVTNRWRVLLIDRLDRIAGGGQATRRWPENQRTGEVLFLSNRLTTRELCLEHRIPIFLLVPVFRYMRSVDAAFEVGCHMAPRRLPVGPAK